MHHLPENLRNTPWKKLLCQNDPQKHLKKQDFFSVMPLSKLYVKS